MKQIIKHSIFSLLVIFFIVTSAFFWLVKSESGLRFLSNRAPHILSIKDVRGNLTDFTFVDMKISNAGAKVSIRSGSLQWSIFDVLFKNVNIQQLSVDGIVVSLLDKQKHEPKKPFAPWKGLKLPVDIRINSLQANNIIIRSTDKSTKNINISETSRPKQDVDKALNFDRLNAEVTIINNQLNVSDFFLSNADGELSINGSVDLTADSQGKLNVSQAIVLKGKIGKKSLESKGTLSGTWRNLVLKQTVLTPFSSTVSVTISDVLTDLIQWNGNVLIDELDAKSISADVDAQIKNGSFQISGSFSPKVGFASLYSSLKGNAIFGNNALSSWGFETDIHFKNDNLIVDLLDLTQLSQAKKVSSENDKTLSALTSDKIGKLSVNGSINNISTFVDTITANAKEISSPSNIPVDTVDSALLSAGTVKEIITKEGVADLSGSWENIGSSLYESLFSINQDASKPPLNFDSDGKFSIKGTSTDFSVITSSEGVAEKLPFKMDIDVQIRTEETQNSIFNVNSASIRSGNSILDIKGYVGESLDLRWEVSSLDVIELLPMLKQSISGDLKSNGRISGTQKKPSIRANVISKHIRYGDYSLKDTIIDADGSYDSLQSPVNLRATLGSVMKGSERLAQKIKLDLSGVGSDHSFTANADLLSDTELSVRAQGGVTDNGWKGRLMDLQLSDPVYEDWKLRNPVIIEKKAAALTMNEACMNNQAQSICVELNSDAKALTANGLISDVNLANINPLLKTYRSSLTGLLIGQFDYKKMHENVSAEFSANLSTSDAIVKIESEQLSPSDQSSADQQSAYQEYTIESLLLDLSQKTEFGASLKLVLENGAQAQGNLNITAPIESIQFQQANLIGKVNIAVDDLAWLPIPQMGVKNLKGALTTDINVSGNISEPSLAIRSQLQNTQISIPDLGLELNDINFTAISKGGQAVDLEGELTSGKGQMMLNGQVDVGQLSNPRVDLRIQGQELQFINTSEFDIVGSLDTSIQLDNNIVNLTGNVSLIKGELDLQLPENAVLASDDVILEGENKKEASIQQRIDLVLDLGDKTHIRAQGLDAFLEGELRLLQEPGGLLRGKGQIDIKNGRYEAYNQKLKIDEGQLVFAGGSIDDPTLNLRAQKSTSKITAGVSVSGRASEPILNLYSTPSLQDQDILSVLIFDKPLSDLGGQDGLTLLRIANSLRGDDGGDNQITVLTERIQNTLGLSNLELQLDGEEPSIRAGKQLSSKLFIGYGYALLDAAQSLILQYKINDLWSIQSDIGAESGADLRYQIQR